MSILQKFVIFNSLALHENDTRSEVKIKIIGKNNVGGYIKEPVL